MLRVQDRLNRMLAEQAAAQEAEAGQTVAIDGEKAGHPDESGANTA